jgi:hypothetical protein
MGKLAGLPYHSINSSDSWIDGHYSAHRGAKEKQCKPFSFTIPLRQALLSSSSIPVHKVMGSQGEGQMGKKKPVY